MLGTVQLKELFGCCLRGSCPTSLVENIFGGKKRRTLISGPLDLL